MSTSALEQRLVDDLAAAGLPAPVREFRFAAPLRQWRFDLCWGDRMVAVEVEGGAFIGGRHGTGAGMTKDCEKLNQAALLGWRVLRFTAPMIRSGEALNTIRRALTPVAAPADDATLRKERR